MRQHATLSPSSAAQWMHCPGSWVIASAAPEQETEYAAEGTRMHAIVQNALENELEAPFDGDIEQAAEYCVEYARMVQANEGVSMVETRVNIGPWTGEKDAKGTVDFAHYSEDDLWVVDWKFGRGVKVSAVRNPQATLYALGILEHVQLFAAPRTIHIVIVQPYLDNISMWDVSVNELKRQGRMIKQKARIARWQKTLPREELLLSPRADICQFCRGRASCPALQDLAESALDRVEAPMTAEELGYWLDNTDSLTQFVTSIKDEAMRRMLNQEPVTGWKLVAGREGARKWNADATAEVATVLESQLGDAAWEKSLLSPAKVEKLLAGRKATEEQKAAWAKVEGAITRAAPKPAMAPAADPRAPWVFETASVDDFDDVEEA